MCRTLTLALVPALLLVTWNEAHAERYIAITGSAAGPGFTYYIGAQSIGSASITTILGPAALPPGEGGAKLRNLFVPELGIPNVGKRSKIPTWIGAGVYEADQVFHGDNVQFWVSLDQTSWQLIPANDWGTFNGVKFADFGSNGPTAAVAGGVPAIGGVGLAVMLVAMLAAGSYVIARRRRPA